MTGPDLRRIAAAVRDCPGVADLHSGDDDLIATDLPDGRLDGVVILGTSLLVGVIGQLPATVSQIATVIRHTLDDLAPDLTVVVSIEDLLPPPDAWVPEHRPGAPDAIT